MRASRIVWCSLVFLIPCVPRATDSEDWWSLRPLQRPAVPELDARESAWARTAVDAFIARRQRDKELQPSAPASRRTLIRRLFVDLLGLPPTPEEVDAFLADSEPDAYERLVDRVLASPAYGERWARHWLDVVHYGDTHGYDKDKLRPNAWPYRDYVVRALNEDKPYARFVREQLAGDVFYPGTRDGIVATGFISAGPWDFIGHAEVPESKIDGKIARHLDRDDMVATTMNTFVSTTVECAQCHDHKFDPVTQSHYYGLQAVFAALDRADRPYDPDPLAAERRKELNERVAALNSELLSIDAEVQRRAGPSLAPIEKRLRELEAKRPKSGSGSLGYHSSIMPKPDVTKWVQVDLGTVREVASIALLPCHVNFNGIGAGFGFPPRYRVEASNDEKFQKGVRILADRSGYDRANPGVRPQLVPAGVKARYIRVTATRLALRQNDYIFSLGELIALDADGKNWARDGKVTSLDSIQAPPAWRRSNLVDGEFYGKIDDRAVAELAGLADDHERLVAAATTKKIRERREAIRNEQRSVEAESKKLAKTAVVYAGTVHRGGGTFRGTGHDGGKPREIRVLRRGDVRQPGEIAHPGAPPLVGDAATRFELPEAHGEGERRKALANWITRADHPLTWRSIANRVWQYHFTRPIVASPNDFGRMGESPTHPDLLDWLAAEFRDGRSIKEMHRLIVTSAVYRQSSSTNGRFANIDAGNRYLWRMNRRRLEAEALRDAVLDVSGKLDRRMGGPGFWSFVLEKPQHSPHYEYHKHDPDDAKTHRRSVYRFIVRSQQDPLMQTLDCADPSQIVGRRSETLTALQALALLNHPFMVRMAEHFATRLELEAPSSLSAQLVRAFHLTLSRRPSDAELEALSGYSEKHGLAATCRVIFNLSEFIFVD
ncbi:MAG: DUF1553 domain-containing protein [Planctomycetota bacterium]